MAARSSKSREGQSHAVAKRKKSMAMYHLHKNNKALATLYFGPITSSRNNNLDKVFSQSYILKKDFCKYENDG